MAGIVNVMFWPLIAGSGSRLTPWTVTGEDFDPKVRTFKQNSFQDVKAMKIGS